ncbi:ATP-dependent DNA helicase RecG [candidate division KSB1 bacterium]|nr:MAG: ATP-dependent DNA helicase RecG [candidate division KSB1 bacterium]
MPLNPNRKPSLPTPSATAEPEPAVSVSRLEAPVSAVPFVGPERQKALASVGVGNVAELLEFYPRRYLDRTRIMRVCDLREMEHEVTIVGTVAFVQLKRTRRGKSWLIAGIDDGTNVLNCLWFQGISYWQKQMREGETVAVSGIAKDFDGWRIIHPAVDRLGEDGDRELYNTGRIISLYPGGLDLRRVGLESSTFRRIMRAALNIAQRELIEYLPEEDLNALGALPRAEAFEQIHFPSDYEHLQAAWQRVRYEELFFYQMLFAYRRRLNRITPGGIAFDTVGPITKKVLKALPFELTEGQKKVLHEIRSDLQGSVPMQRMLQGEVGSGKTTVALLAMAMAADSGYQSAFMAPTELLAQQHAQNLAGPAEAAGLRIRLLRGKQKTVERRDILSAIAAHHVDIVVGTHALLQEKLTFPKLGLVIVDEQHRFGVEQRSILRSKGTRPHLLLMTATPIPRTLRLAQVGDLDESILGELPGGPRQVITVRRSEMERAKIYPFLIEQAKAGGRVFIICPLVEESEKSDIEAATEYYTRVARGVLREVGVGLLHGRMNSEEKQKALDKFRDGKTPILVSTPVVEVGVDIPEAAVMLVENAERFGLAALHQLRGRIGRKGQKAWFILLPGSKITPEAEERLNALLATDDGFVLAQRDLELRGSGEVFGTRQSGEFELRYSNPVRDEALLLAARERAFALVEKDPELQNCPLLRERFRKKHAPKLGLLAGG